MSSFPYEAGRVVVSTAGHDKGKRFVILACEDERYMRIADGSSRTVAHPKRKKILHLKATPVLLDGIRANLDAGSAVYDHEIRKQLLDTEDLPHKEG